MSLKSHKCSAHPSSFLFLEHQIKYDLSGCAFGGLSKMNPSNKVDVRLPCTLCSLVSLPLGVVASAEEFAHTDLVKIGAH